MSEFIHHERCCCRASLSFHAGLWELTGVLLMADAAGNMRNTKPRVRGWFLSTLGYICGAYVHTASVTPLPYLDYVSERNEGGVQYLLVDLLLQASHIHVPLRLRLFRHPAASTPTAAAAAIATNTNTAKTAYQQQCGGFEQGLLIFGDNYPYFEQPECHKLRSNVERQYTRENLSFREVTGVCHSSPSNGSPRSVTRQQYESLVMVQR